MSHPSNSVISSGLAIRFTAAVVISRNRATDAPVYPNFRTFSLVLAWPQFIPFLTPCQVSCLSLFLFAPTSPPTKQQKLGGYQIREIAEHFSRDPVAVCQGLKKVEQSLREDKNLEGVMKALENNLTKNKRQKIKT